MKAFRNKNLNLCFRLTSKEEGQGAFLVKAREERDEGDNPSTTSFPLPSATALWEGGSTSLLTCSDKLLLWQHLGFQVNVNL